MRRKFIEWLHASARNWACSLVTLSLIRGSNWVECISPHLPFYVRRHWIYHANCSFCTSMKSLPIAQFCPSSSTYAEMTKIPPQNERGNHSTSRESWSSEAPCPKEENSHPEARKVQNLRHQARSNIFRSIYAIPPSFDVIFCVLLVPQLKSDWHNGHI